MSTDKKLNRLSGIISILSLTVNTENRYANTILPEGIVVKKTDDILYITDGTTAIRNLRPIADQVLNAAEKTALSNAFSTGNYRIRNGGVVVHNNSGKIDDASLGIIESGKLKVQYLSEFVDNGLIKYTKLPDDVKKGVIIVATYSALNTLSIDDRKKLVVVLDASEDPNGLMTGNGLYYYYNSRWSNLLIPTDLEVTYESVQNVSGIMYDHPIEIGLTQSTIHQVLDELVIGEATDEPDTPTTPDEPDTPIEEEIDSPIQSSYETFINNLNTIVNANSPDLFVEMNRGSMFDYVLRVDVTNVFDTDDDIYINVTDSTLNLTATLTLSRAYDNANIGVVGFKHGDPMYNVTVGRNPNNPVLITVADGTKTATLLYSYENNNYFHNLIEVSEANGWSISN